MRGTGLARHGRALLNKVHSRLSTLDRLYAYAALLGLTSVGLALATLALFGRASTWGITTGESKIGGLVWASAIDPGIARTLYYREFPLASPLTDPSQSIVFGILLGSLIASLSLGEFGIRHIPNAWMALQAVVGGFLLGYGARLALGCNIGNFLSAWASAGLNALSFTAGMLPGIWVGSKLVERVFLPRAGPATQVSIAPSKGLRLSLLAASIAAALLYVSTASPQAALWLAFGAAFGAIGYLSKICWATGLRELVAPAYGSGRMASAVAISIAVYSLGIWALYVAGYPVSLALAKGAGQIQILLGGLIFGIGMGLSGTCIFSSEWRAGGGSVYSLLVFASTVFIGMPILAYHYEWWKAALPQPLPSVSLYNIIGAAAIVPTLVFTSLIALPKILQKRPTPRDVS